MPLLPIEFAIKATLIAVGTGAVLRLLNVKTAAARHAAWAGVTVVMLLLPLWTAWGPKVPVRLLPPPPEQAAQAIASTDGFEPAIERPAAGRPGNPLVPRHLEWNWTAVITGIYLAGVAVLLVRLALGTLQACLLVRRAVPGGGKLISRACAAPVTVGWLRPAMVLPESWSRWPAAQLDAVLTHEREHARRRDPLFQWLALLNRAVFWFHPLSWWLERRMAALAEEACDAVVLAQGHDPRDYSGYLIDMARSVAGSGARTQVWGMALPGGFLEERIRRMLAEGPLPHLSRPRLVCAGIACAITAAAFATSALDRQRPARRPDRIIVLAQARQAPVMVPDGTGVRVFGAERVIHRDALEYPADARAKGIEGTVILDVTLAPDGSIADASVIGGPMELRRASLSSVLKWHFSKEAPVRQQVSVQFSLAGLKPAAVAAPVVTPGRAMVGGGLGPITDLPKPEVLRVLSIRGISQEAAQELRQRLQLEEGQTIDNAAVARARAVAREFNDRLRVTMAATMEGQPGAGAAGMRMTGIALTIELVPTAGSGTVLTDVPRRLRVDIQGLSNDAAAQLRQRLGIREGEIFDHAAFVKELERIHQIVQEFDPHLSDSRMSARVPRNAGADGKLAPPEVIDNTLIISPRNSDVQPGELQQFSRVAKPPGDPLAGATIKLHVDIQGLSPDAAAELRQRLGVREGGTTDSESMKKTLERIRQVMRDFDPRLVDELNMELPPRTFGADGRPIPLENVGATIVIKPR